MNYGLKAIRLAWFWLLIFPLTALSAQPLEWTRPSAGGDGWTGFYWGRTLEEYRADKPSLKSALMLQWLDYFRTNAPTRSQSPRKQ